MGNYHNESDLDFIIVLRNSKTRTAVEIKTTSFIGLRLSLKYGLMVSSLPTSLQKKDTSMQGVYQEVRKREL